MSRRKAIVVIHGMGNQFPMDTLRGFVDALRPEGKIIFSSPNRITGDGETRRLSYSNRSCDFFECYWAHHVEGPGIFTVLKWAVKLLCKPKVSNRLKPLIWPIRIAFVLLLAATCTAVYYLKPFFDTPEKILPATAIAAGALVALRLLWSAVSNTIIGKINGSIGDVIKYTVPSPENIATREKIRKGAIELLTKLHEAKDDDNELRYSEIIVVGHSLGSIVAYDAMASAFVKYHTSFPILPKRDKVDQEKLEEMRHLIAETDTRGEAYQNAQAALLKENKALGNEWRVSHFITLGSPLTHASMLLTKTPKDFETKKEQREFPTCPPVFDERDKHFAYDEHFKGPEGIVTIKCMHHAAHFASTKWTNIYYKNDWVGGNIGTDEFGDGVYNHELTSASKWRWMPLASHTSYWDIKDKESLGIVRQIIGV